MINALIHGRLVHADEAHNEVIGRIVIEGDKPVQFKARRASIKRALLALPRGHPLAAAGTLTTCVRHDKDGAPYVLHSLLITSVLTAEPAPRGLLGFLPFRK